jgi:hypothetical protein
MCVLSAVWKRTDRINARFNYEKSVHLVGFIIRMTHIESKNLLKLKSMQNPYYSFHRRSYCTGAVTTFIKSQTRP